MKLLLKFPLALVASLTFITFVNAQIGSGGIPAPPSLSNIRADSSTVSLEGQFSMALPAKIADVTPIATTESRVRITGLSYQWNTLEANFGVYVADKPGRAANFPPNITLSLTRPQILKDIAGANGKLINESDIMLGKIHGHEFRSETPDMLAVFRLYFADRRIYEVICNIQKSNLSKEPMAMRILNSFKILDDAFVKAEFRRLFDNATPRALPQTPQATKLKSDADDMGLKGNVKMVVEEDEDLSDTAEVVRRRLDANYYFDSGGNLTKKEYCDERGNPEGVNVYGYIDKHRVGTLGKEIEYKTQTRFESPVMSVGSVSLGTPKKAPKSDPRYTLRMEYKYDDKGRLTETAIYQNNGELNDKYTIVYTGDQIERQHKYGDSLFSRDQFTLENGVEKQRTRFNPKTGSVLNKYSYSYDFDSEGNWIKRTTRLLRGADSEPVLDRVTYRTITYY